LKRDVLSRIVSRTLIPLVLVAFAVPFVALMFCAAPVGDDFPKAAVAPPNADGYRCPGHVSSFAVAWAQYANIDNGRMIQGGTGSGRWLSSLLETIVMSKSGLSTSYGWLLLLVMLTNVAALSYFFRSVLRVPRTRALLAASVLYAVWLASLNDLTENVFWLTGALEYQLSISAMLALAGLFCKSRHTVTSYVLLAVLAIAIPAQHEIAGSFLVACLLAGIVAALVLKLPIRPWLLSFGLAALSFAAIMLSPAMISKLGRHSTLLYAFAVKGCIHWVLNPPFLLAAICIPLLLWTSEDTGSEYQPPRWLAVVGIGAICVLLVEYAGLGMVIHRARIDGWFQFVFLVLLVSVILVGVPEASKIRISTGTRIAIFLLFGVSLLSSGNFHQAERDVRGPARSWHRSSIARLAERGRSLQCDPLPPKPILFRESGLSKNPGCWVNQCLAAYLGADSVALKGPSENNWGGDTPCSDRVDSGP